MSTTKRPTAPRQAKPAQRYFRGKAPQGLAQPSDSDSDDDNEDAGPQLEQGDVAMGGEQDVEDEDDEGEELAGGRRDGVPSKAMNVSLRRVDISDGRVIVDGRMESGRTEMEDESGSEEEDDEPDVKPGAAAAEEGSSSEYESSSEEEAPAVPLFRPVFVPKRARVTVQEREAESQNTEEAEEKRVAEAEARKRESHDLVAESIKRELAEKEVQETVPDLDDTDGLDPTAEFEEWRLRELGRIKRDREAALEREEEREEVERRRALPEEQRMKEDMEHAKSTRDEKPKGQPKFLQKYAHKGAFHQDLDVVKNRDYSAATESTVDISLLPQVMQVKNFGKRSRTKYTHLLDQDTTRETKPANMQGLKEGQGCFKCGGPHLARDCPNQDPNDPRGSGQGSGANGRAVAPQVGRQWGVRKDSDMPPPSAPSGPRGDNRNGDSRPSWKDRERDDGRRNDRGDRGAGNRDRDGRGYRDSQRSRSRTPPRRRSRTPPPRRRSRSPPPRRRSRSRSPRDRDWRDRDRDRASKPSHRRPRSYSRSPERSEKRRRRD